MGCEGFWFDNNLQQWDGHWFWIHRNSCTSTQMSSKVIWNRIKNINMHRWFWTHCNERASEQSTTMLWWLFSSCLLWSSILFWVILPYSRLRTSRFCHIIALILVTRCEKARVIQCGRHQIQCKQGNLRQGRVDQQANIVFFFLMSAPQWAMTRVNKPKWWWLSSVKGLFRGIQSRK